MAFITIGAFIFANLIVAVVVTNLERAYEQLKKSKKARYRRLKGQNDQSAPGNTGSGHILSDTTSEPCGGIHRGYKR